MNKFLLNVTGATLVGFLVTQGTLQAQRQTSIDNFTLQSEFDNTSVSLRDFQGKKAVVVVFTSYHCSWSVKYMDRLAQFHTQFTPKGVVFLAINSNDPALEGEIVRISPPAFPFLKDTDRAVATKLGASKNPEVFLLVPQGQNFKVVYHGKIDDNPLDAAMVRHNYLQNALEQVLSGKKVEVAETPPSGCSIKGMEE